MKILAVVPARGGSKGIPLKNIALIAGKPMIEWTIEASQGCPAVGMTLVSTDHPAIAECSRRAGATVVTRPKALAGDETPSRPVLMHAWEHACTVGFEADLVLTLQPTSPLRESHHINEAIALFSRYPEADSLVSVQQVPHQFGPDSLMIVEGPWGSSVVANTILRRQDKHRYWARNGAALYLTRAHHLSSFVWGGRTLVLPMDKISSIDIDDEQDLFLAEAALISRLAKRSGHLD